MSDAWWKSAVLYQIYPRSFADSDGDGVGDLRGILAWLPHLTELGVDALWLSPIFASPMADFGYDVSDYTAIDPLFGSMAAAQRNVASERADPGSLYNLYRRLIALRRAHPALAIGSYRPVMTEGQVLAYIRTHAAASFLIALNLGAAPVSVTMPGGEGTVVLSVLGDRGNERVRGLFNLAGNGGLLIKLG